MPPRPRPALAPLLLTTALLACSVLACSTPPPECGDGVRQADEVCDGTDLGDADCASAGFVGGEVACAPDCTLDVSACETCGNGIVDPGEACDAADLGGQTCDSLGYAAGSLACTSACALEFSGCTHCGDGVVQEGEACDGSVSDAQTCAALGFEGGETGCTADCRLDTSACHACGNGVLDEGEVCDGSAGEVACPGPDVAGGTVACYDACTRTDPTRCETLTGTALGEACAQTCDEGDFCNVELGLCETACPLEPWRGPFVIEVPQPVWVEGTVAYADGTPVDGRLAIYPVRPDLEPIFTSVTAGAFRVRLVPDLYDVQVRAQGSVPHHYTRRYRVPVAREGTLHLTLGARVLVSGRLVVPGRAEGTPVSVTVRSLDDAGASWGGVGLDEDGRWALEVPPGAYALSTRIGYAEPVVLERRLEVPPEGLLPLEHALVPVSGHVTFDDYPVGLGSVVFERVPDGSRVVLDQGAEGAYAGWVLPGRYVVLMEDLPRSRMEVAGPLQISEPFERDFRVKRSLARFQVLLADGTPWRGLGMVSLEEEGGRARFLFDVNGFEAEFWGALQPGRYRVFVYEARGLYSGTTPGPYLGTVDLYGSTQERVTAPIHRVRGRVTREGLDVPDAGVRFRSEAAGQTVWSSALDDGRWEALLPEGQWEPIPSQSTSEGLHRWVLGDPAPVLTVPSEGEPVYELPVNVPLRVRPVVDGAFTTAPFALSLKNDHVSLSGSFSDGEAIAVPHGVYRMELYPNDSVARHTMALDVDVRGDLPELMPIVTSTSLAGRLTAWARLEVEGLGAVTLDADNGFVEPAWRQPYAFTVDGRSLGCSAITEAP